MFETAIFSEEAYATTDDLDSAGSEQTDAMSGDCGADGSNVTWISDEDGTLTISGYGAMMSYSNRNKYWRNAKRVIIQKGVTSIGDSAFHSCSNLTGISIPDSVTKIGYEAFYGCSSLTGIAIPDSVTEIGGYAFYGCDSLISIVIPKRVTSIGRGAFMYCRELTDIEIPDSVTSIGDFAFCICKSLTSVTIPDRVTSIGNSAFYECSKLTDITIPDGVTSIGSQAFVFCKSLTSITIPNSVESIGSEAFCYCERLAGITIPNSVESIGSNAFYNCSGLTTVTIPENMAVMKEDLFRGCSSLESIRIPESVTSIECGAFWGCSGLTDIYYGGGESSWNSIRINSYRNDALTDAAIHYNSKWICLYDENKSDQSSISMSVGKEFSVTLLTNPESFSDKDVRWETDDPDIAAVTGDSYAGKIRGMRAGVTKLRVSCQSYTATCNVCVTTDFYGEQLDFEWEPDDLIVNSTYFPRNVGIGALILSSKAEVSTDALDQSLFDLGLVEGVNDWSRWNYHYGGKWDLGVAHTIALRKYEYGGRTYNLITVVTRGTTEWHDVLSDVKSFGFVSTANKIIKDDLRAFLADRDIGVADENNIFFVTGHSLGGGVSNAMAAQLVDEWGIPADHMNCYTFASPPSTLSTQKNARSKWYIKNMLNRQDWVPYMAHPLTATGRFGQEYWFSPGDYASFGRFFKLFKKEEWSGTGVNKPFGISHETAVYMAALIADGHSDIRRAGNNRRVAVVRCPVDVEVLDTSGIIVGAVKNNTVVSCDDNVALFVFEDEKYIVIPDGNSYSLVLTGTDVGEMIYDIYDYTGNEDSNEEDVKLRSFNAVGLEKGKTMTSNISMDIKNENIDLFVTDKEGNHVAQVGQDGTEKNIVSDSGGQTPTPEPPAKPSPPAVSTETTTKPADNTKPVASSKASPADNQTKTASKKKRLKLTIKTTKKKITVKTVKKAKVVLKANTKIFAGRKKKLTLQADKKGIIKIKTIRKLTKGIKLTVTVTKKGYKRKVKKLKL